jgi:acyl-CoA thioester hydrolase
MADSKQPATFLPLSPAHAAGAPLLHEAPIAVRWGDMDAFQHVNNTVYFRFMEQVRIEWFERIGAALAGTGDIVPNLVGAECRFLRAITYPATVRVTIRLGHWNEKVVQTFHEIWDGETLSAIGDCRILWMSIAAQKSVPMPAAVRAQLERVRDGVRR